MIYYRLDSTQVAFHHLTSHLALISYVVECGAILFLFLVAKNWRNSPWRAATGVKYNSVFTSVLYHLSKNESSTRSNSAVLKAGIILRPTSRDWMMIMKNSWVKLIFQGTHKSKTCTKAIRSTLTKKLLFSQVNLTNDLGWFLAVLRWGIP